MNWILFAFLACFFNTLYILLTSYTVREKFSEYDLSTILTNFLLLMGIIGVVLLIFTKKRLLFLDKDIMSKKTIFLVGLIIINFFLFSIFSLKSTKNTKNPGYTYAIINLNALLVVVLGIFFMKQRINKTSILGMILLTIGLSMVLVNSRKEDNLDMSFMDKFFK